MSVDLSKKEIIIASLFLLLVIGGISFYTLNQNTEEENITLTQIEEKEELESINNDKLYEIIAEEEDIELDVMQEETLLDDIEDTLNVIEEDYEIIID